MKDKTEQTSAENQILEIINAKGDRGELNEIIKKYEDTCDHSQMNDQV